MNILLVRTSAMGDIVHALPVLRALRRAYPEARIGWVVETVFAPILEGYPGLDEVFPVRLRPWRHRLLTPAVLRQIREARRRIRDFAPDVAIDLMGNHKSGSVAWLSGARRRVGARRRDRREPSSALWINEPVAVRGDHAVDRMLSLVAPLVSAPAIDDGGGADFGAEDLLRPAPPEMDGFFAGRAPVVVIQAGAGWANKTYPAARWGAVARGLREVAGVEAVVPVAPGEEALAREVVDHSDEAAEAVEAASFHKLAALLRGSRLVLGGDTGPLHLAHALGTPVLCVMGPTDPVRHGPYRAPERVVYRRQPCSFCHKRYAEPMACLLDIAPREIVARAARMLAAEEGGAAAEFCARMGDPDRGGGTGDAADEARCGKASDVVGGWRKGREPSPRRQDPERRDS